MILENNTKFNTYAKFTMHTEIHPRKGKKGM